MREDSLWKRQRTFLHEKFRALGVKLCPNERFEKFRLSCKVKPIYYHEHVYLFHENIIKCIINKLDYRLDTC